MRPSKFDYHRPATVADAVKLLAADGGAKALAAATA
jgi:CO/xanthine dehydrogenase FAD-binding subunit